MRRRLAILVITAIPLNWMTNSIGITLMITTVQCIFYFMFELSQLLKESPEVPSYAPLIFSFISSIHLGGRFILWLIPSILPGEIPGWQGEDEMIGAIFAYIFISIVLFNLVIKLIGKLLKTFSKIG